MKLSYKATTAEGKVAQGIIDAKGVEDAAYYLRSKNLLPINIQEVKDQDFFLLTLFKKSKSSDVVLFTRELSSMLSSGLTLMQALSILREQVQNEEMKEAVANVISEIQEGKTFAIAIAKYPKIFSSIYVSLIKAGESSGFLDKILLRLADNLEKQQKLRGSIRSALLYPAIVVTLMIIVMGIMMVFVVPQLSGLYQNLNIPLPITTQIVVGIASFMITFWPIIIIAIASGIFFYRRWSKTESGSLIRDDLVLKVPIFGKLLRQTILTEFTRTFGLLVGAGTLVVESLIESADVAGNKIYKNAILDIARRVEKGISVGDGMAVYPIFPPILVQMIRVGEQTGKLDESLLRVSEYFEREVESSIKTLTTALEPVLMIVLGIGVAFLIVSIITPIYSLTSSIQ